MARAPQLAALAVPTSLDAQGRNLQLATTHVSLVEKGHESMRVNECVGHVLESLRVRTSAGSCALTATRLFRV